MLLLKLISFSVSYPLIDRMGRLVWYFRFSALLLINRSEQTLSESAHICTPVSLSYTAVKQRSVRNTVIVSFRIAVIQIRRGNCYAENMRGAQRMTDV